MGEKVEKNDELKRKNREKQNANLLKPEEVNSRLTPEQMKEKMSMMGKISGEKRRKNRMMMDIATKILDMPLSDSYKNVHEILDRMGLPEDERNMAAAMIAMQAVRAATGDREAAKFVRDTAGMDSMMVLKEEQFEYTKENGTNLNVNLEGKLEEDVHIYLPDNGRPVVGDK